MNEILVQVFNDKEQPCTSSQSNKFVNEEHNGHSKTSDKTFLMKNHKRGPFHHDNVQTLFTTYSFIANGPRKISILPDCRDFLLTLLELVPIVFSCYSDEKRITAKRCWAFIAENVVKKRKLSSLPISSNFEASDEFFTYFLYTTENLPDHTSEGTWVRIRWPDFSNSPEFDVHIFGPVQVSLDSIIGFNNTGNIRIWPSEECLAYFLLKNPLKINGKTVLELGAGMTGLAGLVASNSASHVLLSDGNEKSVENLQRIVTRNCLNNISVRIIRWEENEPKQSDNSKFDVIIAADCLFFTENHRALILCLDHFLEDNGEVLIMSPERKGTLRNFAATVKEDARFCYEILEDFDEVVYDKFSMQLEGFVEDLHRIKLLILRRVK